MVQKPKTSSSRNILLIFVYLFNFFSVPAHQVKRLSGEVERVMADRDYTVERVRGEVERLQQESKRSQEAREQEAKMLRDEIYKVHYPPQQNTGAERGRGGLGGGGGELRPFQDLFCQKITPTLSYYAFTITSNIGGA